MSVTLALGIIAGLFFINTIFFIAAFYKGYRALSEIEKLTNMLRLTCAPIMHDATQILADVRVITRSADREMLKVGDSITAVRETARNIKEFEHLLHERIERPLLDVAAVLSGVVKGSKIFWRYVLKR